jgi:hypothetical protein
VGQKVSLKRKDKKTVWQTVQDDGELEDEDGLLDDDDKMKPTKESLESKTRLLLFLDVIIKQMAKDRIYLYI